MKLHVSYPSEDIWPPHFNSCSRRSISPSDKSESPSDSWDEGSEGSKPWDMINPETKKKKAELYQEQSRVERIKKKDETKVKFAGHLNFKIPRFLFC